jgi:O-antigen/teichoic acid export membrane protein
MAAIPLNPPDDHSQDAATGQGLAQRTLGALKWNYLGTLTKISSQFLIGILLARLLGPEPFGLVAIAWLLLGLGNLLADFGLAAALIQKPKITSRDIRHVFTLQILVGLLLTTITAWAAPWVANFFSRADAAPVLRMMAALFVIQAFGQTSTALLRRALNHKRVQVLQVSSYLAGYLLLGVPLAFSGFGVWSLVVAQLTQAGIYSLAAYFSVRHALVPTATADQTGLFSFGSKVLISNITSWGYSSLDSAIVGRMLGVVGLGLYNRSMNLVASPMNAAVSTLQGVLFPLYSRLQGHNDKAARTYLASVCLLSTVLVPLFSAIAAIPDTAILAIYGSRWQEAIALLTPFALAMPVYAVLALGGPMMLGMGKAGMEAAAQAIGILVLILATIIAAKISLAAVAWAVLVVYMLRAVLVTRLAIGLVAINIFSLARALVGPLMLGVASAALAWSIDEVLKEEGLGPVARLALGTGFTGAIIGAAALLLGRWLLCGEARSVLLQASSHVPATVSRLISILCGRMPDRVPTGVALKRVEDA